MAGFDLLGEVSTRRNGDVMQTQSEPVLYAVEHTRSVRIANRGCNTQVFAMADDLLRDALTIRGTARIVPC